MKANVKKPKTSKNFFSNKDRWYSKKKFNWLGLFSFLPKPNYYHWFFCIFSGLLAGFCLPTEMNQTSLSWVKMICAWFALAPMFVVLWLSGNSKQAASKAFITGLFFNLVGFRFVLGIHPLTWLGVPEHLSLAASIFGLLWASLHQAFLWAIFGFVFKLLHKVLGISSSTPFQGAIIWSVWLEKIANSLQFGGNPWTSYYYSQHNNLYLIQSSDLVGASLISFLLIFVNITLANWMLQFLKREGKLPVSHHESAAEQGQVLLSMTSQTAVLLGLVFVYGFIATNALRFPLANTSTTYEALLLQRNLEVSETRLKRLYSFQNVNDYLKLFNKVHSGGNPLLTVIPEGAIPEKFLPVLSRELLKAAPQSNLLAGSYFYNTESNLSYNAAVGFASPVALGNSKACSLTAPHGVIKSQIYLKQALAPFGEYTPLEGTVRKILKIFQLESLAESSFARGNEAKIFNFSFGKISPLICYEVVFPSLFQKQVQAGAQAIVVVGDASWFHNERELVNSQMMAALQFRAIEGRRDILISVNKGPLASIDRFGQVTSYAESEFSFVKFNLNDKETIASKSLW